MGEKRKTLERERAVEQLQSALQAGGESKKDYHIRQALQYLDIDDLDI